MSVSTSLAAVAGGRLSKLRQQSRVLLLLDAAERAGIAPLRSSHLHAFAYLADVLSPVWDLIPFEGKIYKSETSPHYPDLQEELDSLVVVGLVEIGGLHYVTTADGGAQIGGAYALDFSSEHLERILRALGARGREDVLDPSDCDLHSFLVELAGALATLPSDEIESAASADISYGRGVSAHNIVDFGEWVDHRADNRSWRAAERFRTFLPREARMLPGEKLYLYAAYLGRAIHEDSSVG